MYKQHNSGDRLAFLTSQYPAASHTFIRREVEALRELGWSIETFSIRPPGADEAVSGADKAEIVKAVLEGPKQYPAQFVQPTNGQLLWMLDRLAADKRQ